jgi:hypothetical protein
MRRDEARGVVRRVVLGDTPLTDPEVARALLAYPELRAELAGLQEAQRALDATAQLERSAAATARSPGGPQIDVAHALRRLAHRPVERPASSRPWWIGLAAAIALLGAAWWMRSATVPEAEAQPRKVLQLDGLAIGACVPTPEGFVLTWRDTAGAAHYKVWVVGADLDLVSEQLYEAQWTFSAESAAGWPREVTFTVQSFNDAGVIQGRSGPKTVAWPP